jgi:hypothetical protein
MSMFEHPIRREGHDHLEEGKEQHVKEPHSELEAEEEVLADLNGSKDESKEKGDAQS